MKTQESKRSRIFLFNFVITILEITTIAFAIAAIIVQYFIAVYMLTKVICVILVVISIFYFLFFLCIKRIYNKNSKLM